MSENGPASSKSGSAKRKATTDEFSPESIDYVNCFSSVYNFSEKFGNNARLRVFSSGMAFSIAKDCMQEVKKQKMFADMERYGSLRAYCIQLIEDMFSETLRKPEYRGIPLQDLVKTFVKELHFTKDHNEEFQFRNFSKLMLKWENMEMKMLIPLTRDQWNLEKMHFADDDSILIYIKYMMSHLNNFEKKSVSHSEAKYSYLDLFFGMVNKENSLRKILEANIDFLHDQLVSAEWKVQQKKEELKLKDTYASFLELEILCKDLEGQIEKTRLEKEESVEKTRQIHLRIPNMDPKICEDALSCLEKRFDSNIASTEEQLGFYKQEFLKARQWVQQDSVCIALQTFEQLVASLGQEKSNMEKVLAACKENEDYAKEFSECIKEEFEEHVGSIEFLRALEAMTEAECQILRRMMNKVVHNKYVILEGFECLQKSIGQIFGA